LDATDYRPLANLGIVLAREQRYSEAIPFLSESLHLHPDLSEAELRLGEALLESGRLDEAETHLAAAMEAKDSHRPEAMLKLAIVKVEKNDTAGAVMLLESYLAEFPKASNRAEIEYLLKRLRPKFR
jgi:Flp pilus assembly protein TadD